MFWKKERASFVQLVSPSGAEASSILHRMFRFNWSAWRNQSNECQRRAIAEATSLLRFPNQRSPNCLPTEHTALYSLAGSEYDLMMLNIDKSIEALNISQLRLSRTEFFSYLIPAKSYLSVEELSQRALLTELNWAVPQSKYLCFYTMTGTPLNPVGLYHPPRITGHRERMMHALEHMAQQHVDDVKQVVSGSIGLDGWEWAVDMFGDDPLVFKKLIYDLRFKEGHAIAAASAGFYLGLQLEISDLESWSTGELGRQIA